MPVIQTEGIKVIGADFSLLEKYENTEAAQSLSWFLIIQERRWGKMR